MAYIHRTLKHRKNNARKGFIKIKPHPHRDVIRDAKIMLRDQDAGNIAGLQIPEITDTLTYDFYLELKGKYLIFNPS